MQKILLLTILMILGLSIEIIFLWDFILQLAGLNEDLSDNNCEWRKRTIKHLHRLFPKKNKMRSFKKVTPEYLYVVIFCFQMVLYLLFLLSLINSIVCYVLFLIAIETKIIVYWFIFILSDMLISGGILSVAYYVVHKKCIKSSRSWNDFN